MKRSSTLWWLVAAALFLAGTAWTCPAYAQPDVGLQRVLKQMDDTAANFHTTQASFVWSQYQKVVEDTDTQKGKVYFRRTGDQAEMAADIIEHNDHPDSKYVLFSDSKVEVYQPNIEQVTVINTGKNRGEFESFLVLGFGGSGHDMLKSFDVKYL